LVYSPNSALDFTLSVSPYVENEQITLTGTGTVFSYSSLNAGNQALLESLIGQTLVVDLTPNTFSSISVSQVPIPPTVWLFGSAFIGLIGVTRRLRRA
jgi:hypothetical protein